MGLPSMGWRRYSFLPSQCLFRFHTFFPFPCRNQKRTPGILFESAPPTYWRAPIRSIFYGCYLRSIPFRQAPQQEKNSLCFFTFARIFASFSFPLSCRSVYVLPLSETSLETFVSCPWKSPTPPTRFPPKSHSLFFFPGCRGHPSIIRRLLRKVCCPMTSVHSFCITFNLLHSTPPFGV